MRYSASAKPLPPQFLRRSSATLCDFEADFSFVERHLFADDVDLVFGPVKSAANDSDQVDGHREYEAIRIVGVFAD